MKSWSDETVLNSVRATYDTVAEPYAREFAEELAAKPLDRALIDAFADQVGAVGAGAPVADLGCGPGHVTRYLHDRGLDMVGVDLSPAMIRLARGLYPEIDFREGSILDLRAPDAAWAAALSLYSIIHLPWAAVPDALGEFFRVLRSGGLLLLAFHAGDERLHLDEWFGRSVSIDGYLFEPGAVAEALAAAGFVVKARLYRRPYPDIEVATDRAYFFAHKP